MDYFPGVSWFAGDIYLVRFTWYGIPGIIYVPQPVVPFPYALRRTFLFVLRVFSSIRTLLASVFVTAA